MGQTESSTKSNAVNAESESAATIDQNKATSVSPEYYERRLLRECEHIPFDVEAWYKILCSQTFYTEFIPISPSIARAFVNYYQTRYNSKQLLNSNDVQLIQSIEHQLKEQIFSSKDSPFQTNGTFIRLSSRSPKDGCPLNLQTLVKLYHQELAALQVQYPNECDSMEGRANMQLIACCSAQFQSLKSTNEFDALNLILSSERVFIDLLAALDCQDVKDNQLLNTKNIVLPEWNNNIIIREWNHLLDPSMEFRCFVCKSNLTAISQYNHYCKFYHLQSDSTIQRIKSTIIQYWQQKVKPLLDPFNDLYSNYVIDFALIENKISNEFECVVIELNPFAKSTGASLFDWQTDIDQLTEQRNEIEIRVRSDYFPNICEYVEYVLAENELNANKTLSSENDDKESYFSFLNKIQVQLA
ncbi:unnamed protein product [Rotaria sp. Silwood2]|nr:unnamed protein product [Rotaria sp. Silwood2]CAF4105057.1 unnamed protein product [Rotaria sp. Silwood2]